LLGENMVRKVRTEVQFGAEVNRGWDLNEHMTDVPATQRWVDAVRTTGNHEWREMAGHGQFEGLQEDLSAKAAAAIGQCESGEDTDCVVDVTVENVYDGTVNGGKVVLRCPLRLFMLEQDAAAAEAICIEHHRGAPAKFKTHVTTAAERFNAADQARADAEKAYQAAEQSL
jgi:hypothetical protein